MSNLQTFIDDLTVGGRSLRTAETYAACVRGFERTISVPLANASRGDVAYFIRHLIHGRRRAPSTVKNFVCALRYFFEHTMRRPEVVEGLRAPRVTPKPAVVLSVEEVTRLLECIKSSSLYTIASLLYGTGMRLGEALAITVRDIDASRGLITVRHTKTRRPRVVRMSNELLLRLREHWRLRRPPDELLFPGLDPSRPFDPSAVQHSLRRAARVAGITKRVTPHVLRHSYATHLIESGVDIHTVQLLLGHSSIFMTLQYLHLSEAHLAGRPLALPALLGDIHPKCEMLIPSHRVQPSRFEHKYARSLSSRESKLTKSAESRQMRLL